MEKFKEDDIRYVEAKKRVKIIKGFFIHAIIYMVVNAGLIITNISITGEVFSSINTYWTAIFWGIGLVGHGMSVFLPNLVLGKNWEEQKIRELMNRNK